MPRKLQIPEIKQAKTKKCCPLLIIIMSTAQAIIGAYMGSISKI
jgi:hypothetical protein